jgi:hypothetical protein
LDFGEVFSGSNYWLEIAVRTNGNGTFTILEPRQFLTPVPYAVFSANASNAVSAESVSASGIVGTISSSNLGSNVALLTANGTLPTNVLPPTATSPGGIVWQSPSATTVQAQSNVGYLLTNSQPVTITLPAAPNVGDIVEIAGAGPGGRILDQNPGQTIAAVFNPVSLPSDLSGMSCIASSADGTKLVAGGEFGGGIWTSTNSGTNWEQTSASTSPAWLSIASSSDGTKLAALQGDRGIWTSSNGGTNWVQTSAPFTNWQAIASSSDGTRLVAVAGIPGGIWASSNSGATWWQTGASTNFGWSSIASSSNGMKLAAGIGAYSGEAVGGIWTSGDGGTNWMQTSAPLTNWPEIVSSSDGSKLVAINNANEDGGGGIWISTNSGTNWIQTSAPTNSAWSCIACSSDGTKLAAGSAGEGIWTSTNAGANWVPMPIATTFYSDWQSIALSSDATKLAAVDGEGVIWTFYDGNYSTQSGPESGATIHGTAGFLEGTFGAVVELIYAGGGQFIALYQNGSFQGR